MAIQFNDTASTRNGLIQECETTLYGDNYGVISGSTKKLATFTRLINTGLNRLQALIMESDTRWQFDDSNYTNYPIGRTDLVDGQQDYVLDDAQIKVSHVYVLDQNGKQIPVQPFDERDLAKRGIGPDSFLETDGLPKYYDKKANALFLYPKPATASVTLTNGLIVAYQREPSYFATSDTTKKAGVPELFQIYPAIHASYEYAVNNQMEKKIPTLLKRKEDMEAMIREFYNKRDADDKPQMRVRKINYR